MTRASGSRRHEPGLQWPSGSNPQPISEVGCGADRHRPLGSHSQPALGAGRHWPLGSNPQPALVPQSEEKNAQNGSKRPEGAVEAREAARTTAMKLRRIGEISTRHRPRTSLARGGRVPQS